MEALSPRDLELATAALLGLVLGSIPFGVLIGRLHGVDPRQGGSGNVGTVNVLRTAGRRAAGLTLLGDAGKGLAAVLAARLLQLPVWAVGLAAVAAVAGHVWSPWLGFRGGKGVATGLGAFGGLSPYLAAALLAVYGVVVWRTGYSSAGSVAAALVAPPAAYMASGEPALAAAAVAAAVLIVARHRGNLARLRAGRELAPRAGAAPGGLSPGGGP